MQETPPCTRFSQLANAEVQAVRLHLMHMSFIQDCPVALIGAHMQKQHLTFIQCTQQ